MFTVHAVLHGAAERNSYLVPLKVKLRKKIPSRLKKLFSEGKNVDTLMNDIILSPFSLPSCAVFLYNLGFVLIYFS